MIINGVFGQIVEYDNHCQYEIDQESKKAKYSMEWMFRVLVV